jgi:flagellar biosynthesis/type III secretory pathway chaperone
MGSYPADIRRCEHIKTSGTQCGSPALRKKKLCYYHQECRPERVQVKGGDGKRGEILVPVFEDANSIQMMVRRVVVLLLEDKIDSKKAGLVVNSLRIASSNLKRMEEEKPRPVQVVVDVDRVGETPVGMTPWSGRPGGHEPEEVEDRVVARTKRAILEDEQNVRRAKENRHMEQQLSQITKKMESYGEEVEESIAKDDATVNGLKQVVKRVKRKMEDVADANLHNRTLDEAEMLSKEEEEEWAKQREKRNTPVARQVRALVARHRE